MDSKKNEYLSVKQETEQQIKFLLKDMETVDEYENPFDYIEIQSQLRHYKQKLSQINLFLQKECPNCGQETLMYMPPKKTKDGFFPANYDCLNCGYSTPVALEDDYIMGLGW